MRYASTLIFIILSSFVAQAQDNLTEIFGAQLPVEELRVIYWEAPGEWKYGSSRMEDKTIVADSATVEIFQADGSLAFRFQRQGDSLATTIVSRSDTFRYNIPAYGVVKTDGVSNRVRFVPRDGSERFLDLIFEAPTAGNYTETFFVKSLKKGQKQINDRDIYNLVGISPNPNSYVRVTTGSWSSAQGGAINAFLFSKQLQQVPFSRFTVQRDGDRVVISVGSEASIDGWKSPIYQPTYEVSYKALLRANKRGERIELNPLNSQGYSLFLFFDKDK